MKNILVPIDFSKASVNAAKYAVFLAEPFNATITLINAVSPAIIIDDSILASVMITQAEILDGNKELMEKEMEALSQTASIKLNAFVREGYPLDVILEMAKEMNSDLVIMGMKGKGKSNSVFGSTTTAIIRKSFLPVFVIPENAIYQSIDTITFATDFDPQTDWVHYSLLMELAKKHNSFIQILNVQKNEMQMKEDEFIGKMRTQFAFSDLKHRFNTIEDKKVIEGINKFIEENRTDILVMMAHQHSFFERMLGKGHTKAMSHETKIPLLVLQNK
jgi:nucleotide-binding universal stress UspA family protein